MSRPGSTVLTFGLFSLAQGTRIAVPRNRGNSVVAAANNTNVTYFMNYVSTFQCYLDDFLGTDVRVFSPRYDIPLPDNTVVFLTGRICTSAGGNALIDVLHMAPFPGDPADPDYDSHLPDEPNPYIVVLGVVVGQSEDLPDGARAFRVEAQAHVCGQFRTSVIKCIFEGDSPRWQHMRTPAARSFVHVVGTCRHICADGSLAITVTDITFNVTPPVQLPHNNPSSSDSSDSPSPKRRRFNAIAPVSSKKHSQGQATGSSIANSPSTSQMATILPTMPSTSTHEEVTENETNTAEAQAAAAVIPNIIENLNTQLNTGGVSNTSALPDRVVPKTRSRKGKERASD